MTHETTPTPSPALEALPSPVATTRRKPSQRKPGELTEATVWLNLKTAAALTNDTASALRKRVERGTFPKGVVSRVGRIIKIHRQRYLAWMDKGGTAQ
jgi:hypothetical protein